MFSISKADNLYQLVEGDQLYWAFPFSKNSLSWSELDEPWQNETSLVEINFCFKICCSETAPYVILWLIETCGKTYKLFTLVIYGRNIISLQRRL